MTRYLPLCAIVLATTFAAVGAGHPTVDHASSPRRPTTEAFIPPSFDIEISPLPAQPDVAADAPASTRRFAH